MTAEEIFQRTLKSIPDSLTRFEAEAAQPWAECRPESLGDLFPFLRDDPEIALDCLDCLTAIDLPDDQLIVMVYHLYSYKHRHSFILKTSTSRETPEVRTSSDIWPAGNWYEREAYDLFGVRFTGHPGLTRLFLPDDWPGHPFLKDWKEPEAIWGIPTTRPDPLVPKGKEAAPAKKKPKFTPEELEELKRKAAERKAAAAARKAAEAEKPEGTDA